MSPNLQLQIFNPATGQFVQCDGGNDSTQALLLQILLQMVEMNTYLAAQVGGRTPTDDSATIRASSLSDTSMFQTG